MPQITLPNHCSSALKDVDVFLWQLTESKDDLVQLLPDATLLIKEPYVHFKAERRQKEWLAVRVLMAQVGPEGAHIVYDANGRPSLVPKVAELSISHTNGVVSVALSQRPVGIDVEQFGTRALKLRDHFLQAEEFDFSSVGDAELMATWMWSAKESVYKLYGKPGLELKADIRLSVVRQDGETADFMAKVNTATQESRVRCFKMEGYVLTVATFCD